VGVGVLAGCGIRRRAPVCTLLTAIGRAPSECCPLSPRCGWTASVYSTGCKGSGGRQDKTPARGEGVTVITACTFLERWLVQRVTPTTHLCLLCRYLRVMETEEGRLMLVSLTVIGNFDVALR
jgi:hypothetical protein